MQLDSYEHHHYVCNGGIMRWICISILTTFWFIGAAQATKQQQRFDEFGLQNSPHGFFHDSIIAIDSSLWLYRSEFVVAESGFVVSFELCCNCCLNVVILNVCKRMVLNTGQSLRQFWNIYCISICCMVHRFSFHFFALTNILNWREIIAKL